MSDQVGTELSRQAAKMFRDMADAVDLNGASFAGAFVIFGPDGQVKKMLMVSDQPEHGMFWSDAKVACDLAIAEIESKQTLNQRWG